MNLGRAMLWAISLSFLSGLGASALAKTVDLEVLPLTTQSNPQGSDCPATLRAYETPDPYRAGGFSTQGMIQLSAIATDINVSQTDSFSTAWVGTLKPQYQNCTASAGMFMVDGERYPGQSYIRVQLIDGKAKVILDMTGIADANRLTSVVLTHTLRDGDPRWTWGGTD
ncbi:MAG: hypothetical protein WA949_02795 [Phormidesmis sp.]